MADESPAYRLAEALLGVMRDVLRDEPDRLARVFEHHAEAEVVGLLREELAREADPEQEERIERAMREALEAGASPEEAADRARGLEQPLTPEQERQIVLRVLARLSAT